MPTLITSYYADTLVDTLTLSKHYTVINAVAPIDLSHYGDCMTANVAAVVDVINNTTGTFALAGLSGGAWIMSKVLDEIQTGSLTSRQSDFLGAVSAGNPRREAGKIFPGGTDPGGHGIVSTGRLSGTPSKWWEFSTAGDVISCCADDTAGELYQAVFAWLYNDYTGDAAGLAAAAAAEFPSNPLDQLNTLLEILYTGFTWAWTHMTYALQSPLSGSGDHRSTMQIATDYLVMLANNNPSGTTVITLDGEYGLTNMSSQLKGIVTNGNTVETMPFGNWQTYPDGAEFDQGVNDLNALILNTSGNLVVFGYGMGAATACGWLTTYGPTSTVGPERLRFVLIANPLRRYGGLLATSVDPPPADSPYAVLDIARQYDGWCDWPTLLTPPDLSGLDVAGIIEILAQLGTIAGQNAALGMLLEHSTYNTIDLHQSEFYEYIEDNTTYRLYTSYPAPIVTVKNPFGLAAYLSQQDSQTRPLIENKYRRPMLVPR